MIVFRTQLPLKNSITGSHCLELFLKWISEDHHCSICQIPYDLTYGCDFDYQKRHIQITIRHYKNGILQLSACRYLNMTGKVHWQSDCIYCSKNDQHWVLIEQRRLCSQPDDHTYRIRKPHIVRMLLENGFCTDDNGIPITDLPIDAGTPYICDGTILKNTQLPCVLISCDSSGIYGVDCRYIAAQLGGMAHTFVQNNSEALPLAECAVHNGRIGIFMPGKGLSQCYCPTDFENDRVLTRQIINHIRTGLTETSPVYDWERVLSLIAAE